MKLVRVDQDQFHFELGQEEQIYLYHLLFQYPLVPAGYQAISRQREAKTLVENQQLLEETLQERRVANRKQIVELLNQQGRFQTDEEGKIVKVTFTRGEIEWLLQICNDIRIGSWLALGSPELDERNLLYQDPAKVRYVINIEIAGQFEVHFIHALDGGGNSGSEDETTNPVE